jgi:hypothetical protein
MLQRILPILTILTLGMAACQDMSSDYPIVEPVERYLPADFNMDSLRSAYGYRKDLPEGFELQTLLALRHYPELAQTKIKFIINKAFIPLSSRPSVFSLLRKRDHRIYRVIISDKSLPQMENVLLKNLPFNAQVAIIGHELAHTAKYQTLNSYELMLTGILYFFGSFRASMEKRTDLQTIEHGLGWQLLEYAEYVREVSGSSQRQIDFMDKYYMSPEEIKAILDRSELYQPDTQDLVKTK